MTTNPIRTFLTFCFAIALFEFAGAGLRADDKLPVIVDTDMGFDDWMAVLYLLNKDDIDIVAITVDGAGETHTPKGAVNVTKLIGLAGKKNIPVYYGEQPAATLHYQFPKVIRESATAMKVPGFDNLPASENFSGGAAGQILKLAIKAGKMDAPLSILSIGTSTNIAQAIEQARADGSSDAFARGIGMIYKGGGAFGKETGGVLTNEAITGNLNIPDLFESKNTTAEWNIYAHAAATGVIVASGLPVTFVPTNLSDQVKITEQSFNDLKKMAASGPAKFVVSEIEDTIKSQGGWTKAELEYWDPSVVVAALNPGFVTKKFDGVRVCVDSREGVTHGTIYVDVPEGNATLCQKIQAQPGTISVYTAIDAGAFYRDFFGTLNRE